MAFGAALLVGCGDSGTTETDAATPKDTATSAEVSTDTGSAADTAVNDSVAMPYGAPPMDGLLV